MVGDGASLRGAMPLIFSASTGWRGRIVHSFLGQVESVVSWVFPRDVALNLEGLQVLKMPEQCLGTELHPGPAQGKGGPTMIRGPTFQLRAQIRFSLNRVFHLNSSSPFLKKKSLINILYLLNPLYPLNPSI